MVAKDWLKTIFECRYEPNSMHAIWSLPNFFFFFFFFHERKQFQIKIVNEAAEQKNASTKHGKLFTFSCE